MTIHVGFVVHRVALEQVILQVLQFFPAIYYFTGALFSPLSSSAGTVG
jgi:hypothetical protein